MSIDAYIEKGVVVPVESLLAILDEEIKDEFATYCEDLYARFEKSGEVNMEPFGCLKNASGLSLQDLKKMLIDLSCNDPDKYSDEIGLFWENYIRCVTDCDVDKLPWFEIEVFDSDHTPEPPVPSGMPCLVFDSDECLETTLTEKGETLKSFVGHCDENSWVVLSY